MDIYRVFLLSSMLAIAGSLFNHASAAVSSLTGIDIDRTNPLTSTDGLMPKLPVPLSKPKDIAVPLLTQEIDLGAAKKYSFKLKKVTFEGNTAISSDELLQIYRPYIGKTINLAKLLELIRETTKLYRDRGYILSQAYLPAQDIDKTVGHVKIGIVEGYINSINVNSESIPYSTKLLLQQYGERMAKERPLTKATLERYALLSSDLPGGDIRVVFTPAKNKPGAADVEFIAEDTKLFGGAFSYDNYGTKLLGPYQMNGTLYQYNALYGNKTMFNAIRADHKELKLYFVSHKQPLNSDGLAFTAIATKIYSKPNFNALPEITSSALETPGFTEQYIAQLEYPIVRSRNYNLQSQAKLDMSNNITKFSGETLFKERLRTLRLGLTYDWLDSWVFDILSVSLIGVEFSQGIDGLKAFIKPDRDLATRPNTDEKYRKITGTLSRTQPLTQQLTLKLLGLGQYGFDELVASEEFGYGGRLVGLGYDPYQISGDHGISGKAELIYKFPMVEWVNKTNKLFNLHEGSIFNQLNNLEPELFVFYDGARTWNKNSRSSGQVEHDSAVSAGWGLRGTLLKYLTFEGYMAKPMTRTSELENDKKPRWFFSVGVSYI